MIRITDRGCVEDQPQRFDSFAIQKLPRPLIFGTAALRDF
jgi:hypothetical protein